MSKRNLSNLKGNEYYESCNIHNLTVMLAGTLERWSRFNDNDKRRLAQSASKMQAAVDLLRAASNEIANLDEEYRDILHSESLPAIKL